MAGGQAAKQHVVLHGVRQLQQAKGVGHVAARLAHRGGGLVLGVGHAPHQRLVGLGLLHGVEVFALDVLYDGDLESLVIVQDHVLFGRLTAGHARAILSAAFPEVLAQTIVEKGLSVRDAEALAKKGGEGGAAKKASGPRRAGKNTDTAALEVDLEDALGMSVDIVDRDGVGEIRIKYATLEQLDELCRRLTRR